MLSRKTQVAYLIESLRSLVGEAASEEAEKRLTQAMDAGRADEVAIWFEVWTTLVQARRH